MLWRGLLLCLALSALPVDGGDVFSTDVICPAGSSLPPAEYRNEIRLVDLYAPRTISVRANGEQNSFACDYVATKTYAPTIRVIWDSRNTSTFFYVPLGTGGHYYTKNPASSSNSQLPSPVNNAGYFLNQNSGGDDACLFETDCAACTARPSCGWCSKLNICTSGAGSSSFVGELAGRCANATWSFSASTCSSCPPGYSGSTCNSWECYEKQKDAADVCGGVGTCLAPNDCDCTHSQFEGPECDEGAVTFFAGCNAAREDTSRGNASHPEAARTSLLGLRYGELIAITGTAVFRDADLLWTLEQISGDAATERQTVGCGMRVATTGSRLPSSQTAVFRVTKSGASASFAVVTYGTTGSYYDGSIVVQRLGAFSSMSFGKSCETQRLQTNGTNDLVGTATLNAVPALSNILVFADISVRAPGGESFGVDIVADSSPSSQVVRVGSCDSAYSNSTIQSSSHVALFRSIALSSTEFKVQVSGRDNMEVDAVNIVARVLGPLTSQLAAAETSCPVGTVTNISQVLSTPSVQIALEDSEYGVVYGSLSVHQPDLTWLIAPADNQTNDISSATCEELVLLPQTEATMWRVGVFRNKDAVGSGSAEFGLSLYGTAGNISATASIAERVDVTLPPVWQLPASSVMRFGLTPRTFVLRDEAAKFGTFFDVEPFMLSFPRQVLSSDQLVVDVQIRGTPWGAQYTPEAKVEEAKGLITENSAKAVTLGASSLTVNGETFSVPDDDEETSSTIPCIGDVLCLSGLAVALCIIAVLVVVGVLLYLRKHRRKRSSRIDNLVAAMEEIS